MRNILCGSLIGLSLVACYNEVTSPLEPSLKPHYNDTTSAATRCAQPSVARRLSHFEYRNILEDLFPNSNLPNFTLPPDASPFGYDNDAASLQANGALLESYFETAVAVAEAVVTEALSRAGCDGLASSACAPLFVDHWSLRLFRRPADATVDASLQAFFSDANVGSDVVLGGRLALQAMLLSPEFLYRFESSATPFEGSGESPADPYTLASRLSFAIWGSTPDATLLDAAAANALSTTEALAAQAYRMLADPRAERGIEHFYGQWLDLDRIYDAKKLDSDNLTPELRHAMVRETLTLARHLTLETQGTLRDLLTTSSTFVNAELAALYGVSAPGEAWGAVGLDATQRAGILTHASFLASRAHSGNPSPVLRGVFVLDRIMCRSLGSPPPEAESAMVDDATATTNRERYDVITRSSAQCDSCHQYINNAGYPFENYDTMGRYITTDGGTPVDASGALWGATYADAVQFADALGRDPSVEQCFAENFQQFVYGTDTVRENSCIIDDVTSGFAATGGTLEELIVATVTHPQFRTYNQTPAE